VARPERTIRVPRPRASEPRSSHWARARWHCGWCPSSSESH
jgi:hypothetical protein